MTRNGVTTNYTYQNGNITSVTQNGTAVKTYGYTDSTWGDLLTSFNGQTVTYDAIGNPLQYRDGMSFTWAKGRQLQGIAKDGLNASYTYDENGLRLSKTVNGVTTKIFRTNGQMVGMNMSDGKDMTFLLDDDGKVYGVHYDHYSFDQKKTETYYFAFNAQGDVIGIYEFYGKVIATYDYDEWGNCTVNVLCEDNNGHAVDSPDHIAYANPFRYRGYFYDAETGFYYLNSRYYDPDTGRFVNADGYVSTGDGLLEQNMFAYCINNPVHHVDPNGTAHMCRTSGFCPVCGFPHPTSSSSTTLGPLVSLTPLGGLPSLVPEPPIPPGTVDMSRGRGKEQGPRKDPRKGSDQRQPTGNRERNVGHPNGEEHSRVPKGNGVRRTVAAIAVIGISASIAIIVVDNVIGVGVADDLALPPLVIAWDQAYKIAFA